MIIELRGKKWKQITKTAYIDLENHHKAIFNDEFWNELTYFKEILVCECDCHAFVGGSGKACPQCIKEKCEFCVNHETEGKDVS